MSIPRLRATAFARALWILLLAGAAIGQDPIKAQREKRQAIASGKTLVVSVSATGKPITEVLAELQQATGVTIERGAVPADSVTTLAKAELSLWDAVDQICRAHGKLAWDVAGGGIAIRSEPYARPNLATTSGYGVLFRGFERTAEGGVRSNAVVIGPPGAVVAVHYLTYSELVDDKGTNLLKAGGGPWQRTGKSTFGSPQRLTDPDPSRAFCEAPQDFLEATPAPGATRIKSCKGTAFVRSVAQLKKGVEIAGANLKKGAMAKAADAALEIESVDVAGESVSMVVAITDPRRGAKDKTFFYPELGGMVVLRDSAGSEVRGVALKPTTGSTSLVGPGAGGSETMRCEVTGRLPAKTTLSAIELWEPAEVEEVKIAFAFKDVPITEPK